MPDFVAWVLNSPWWVPGALALILTLWLIWITLPNKNEPLLRDYRSLKSEVEQLRAQTAGQKEALWADEQCSLVSDADSSGRQTIIFDNVLAQAPNIILLKPISGKEANIESVSKSGFIVRYKQWDYRIKTRFFAYCRSSSQPKPDYIESLLNGKWLGTRFIFNEPKVLIQSDFSDVYESDLCISAKPCPPNVIAEVEFDCGPGSQGSGLAFQGKAVVGQGVLFMPVDDKQNIHFGNYASSFESNGFSLKLQILGWRSIKSESRVPQLPRSTE